MHCKSIGITVGDLRKFASEGMITTEVLVAALRESSKEIAKEFEGMTATVAQSLTVLENSFINLIGKSEAFKKANETLGDKLRDIGAALDKQSEAADQLGKAYLFVAENVEIVVGFFAGLMALIIGGGLIALVVTVAGAFGTLFGVASLGIPILAGIVLGLSAIVGVLATNFVTGLQDTGSEIDSFNEKLKEIGEISDVIERQQNLTDFLDELNRKIKDLKNNLDDVKDISLGEKALQALYDFAVLVSPEGMLANTQLYGSPEQIKEAEEAIKNFEKLRDEVEETLKGIGSDGEKAQDLFQRQLMNKLRMEREMYDFGINAQKDYLEKLRSDESDYAKERFKSLIGITKNFKKDYIKLMEDTSVGIPLNLKGSVDLFESVLTDDYMKGIIKAAREGDSNTVRNIAYGFLTAVHDDQVGEDEQKALDKLNAIFSDPNQASAATTISQKLANAIIRYSNDLEAFQTKFIEKATVDFQKMTKAQRESNVELLEQKALGDSLFDLAMKAGDLDDLGIERIKIQRKLERSVLQEKLKSYMDATALNKTQVEEHLALFDANTDLIIQEERRKDLISEINQVLSERKLIEDNKEEIALAEKRVDILSQFKGPLETEKEIISASYDIKRQSLSVEKENGDISEKAYEERFKNLGVLEEQEKELLDIKTVESEIVREAKERLTLEGLIKHELMDQLGLSESIAGTLVSGIAGAGPAASRGFNIGNAAMQGFQEGGVQGAISNAVLSAVMSNEKVSKAINEQFEILFDVLDPLLDIFAELQSAINRLIAALLSQAGNIVENFADALGIGPDSYYGGGGFTRDIEKLGGGTIGGSAPTNFELAVRAAVSDLGKLTSDRSAIVQSLVSNAEATGDLTGTIESFKESVNLLINEVATNYAATYGGFPDSLSDFETVAAGLYERMDREGYESLQEFIENFSPMMVGSEDSMYMREDHAILLAVANALVAVEELVDGIVGTTTDISAGFEALTDMVYENAQAQIDSINFQNMTAEDQIDLRHKEVIASLESQRALLSIIESEEKRAELLGILDKAEKKQNELYALQYKQLDKLNDERERELQLQLRQDQISGLEGIINDFNRAMERIADVVEEVFQQINDLLFSEFNLETPMEAFNRAREEYVRLFDLASDMDASEDDVKAYQQFVNQYLTASRDVFKSSSQFQKIFEGVLKDLNNVGLQYGFGQPLGQVGDTTNELEELAEELGVSMDALIRELKALAIEFVNQQLRIGEISEIKYPEGGLDVPIKVSEIELIGKLPVPFSEDNFTVVAPDLGTISPTATAGTVTVQLGNVVPNFSTTKFISAINALNSDIANSINALVQLLTDSSNAVNSATQNIPTGSTTSPDSVNPGTVTGSSYTGGFTRDSNFGNFEAEASASTQGISLQEVLNAYNSQFENAAGFNPGSGVNPYQLAIRSTDVDRAAGRDITQVYDYQTASERTSMADYFAGLTDSSGSKYFDTFTQTYSPSPVSTPGAGTGTGTGSGGIGVTPIFDNTPTVTPPTVNPTPVPEPELPSYNWAQGPELVDNNTAFTGTIYNAQDLVLSDVMSNFKANFEEKGYNTIRRYGDGTGGKYLKLLSTDDHELASVQYLTSTDAVKDFTDLYESSSTEPYTNPAGSPPAETTPEVPPTPDGVRDITWTFGPTVGPFGNVQSGNIQNPGDITLEEALANFKARYDEFDYSVLYRTRPAYSGIEQIELRNYKSLYSATEKYESLSDTLRDEYKNDTLKDFEIAVPEPDPIPIAVPEPDPIPELPDPSTSGYTGNFVTESTGLGSRIVKPTDQGVVGAYPSTYSTEDYRERYLSGDATLDGESFNAYGMGFAFRKGDIGLVTIYDYMSSSLNAAKNMYADISHRGRTAQFGHSFRYGGYVHPLDTIPAMLAPGEFIMSPEAVNRIGVSNLNMMNSGGTSALSQTSDPQVRALLRELINTIEAKDTEVNVYTDMRGQAKAAISEFRTELRDRSKRQGSEFVNSRYI